MQFQDKERLAKVANRLLTFQVPGMEVPIFLDAPDEPHEIMKQRHSILLGGLAGMEAGSIVAPMLAQKMTARVGALIDRIPSRSGRVGAIKTLLGGLGALVGLGLYKSGSEIDIKTAALIQACAKDPRIVKVAAGMIKEAMNPLLMGATAIPGAAALGTMVDVPPLVTDIAGAGAGAYLANKAVQQYTPEMIQKLYARATKGLPALAGKLPFPGSQRAATVLNKGIGKLFAHGAKKPAMKYLGKYAPWAGAGAGLIAAMIASDLVDW